MSELVLSGATVWVGLPGRWASLGRRACPLRALAPWRLGVEFQLALRAISRLACLLPIWAACGANGLTNEVSNVLSNDWSVQISDYAAPPPAVAPDGTIYFGTFKGKLWAVSRDGYRKWTFAARNEIKSA